MYDLTLDIVFKALTGLEFGGEQFSVMRRHPAVHNDRATKLIAHVRHERGLRKAIKHRSLGRKSP